MASQQKSLAAVVLVALVASVAAQTLTVTLVVPFGPTGVPLPGTGAVNQAGFKDTLLKAYINALEYVAVTTLLSPGGLPPAVSAPRTWTFDTVSSPQTATVAFEYSTAWSTTLFYLMASPGLVYTHPSITAPATLAIAGRNLIQQYGAIGGNTVDAVAHIPPSPPPPRSPPPPSPAPSPPSPPPAPFLANTSATFVATGLISSAFIPTDAGNRTIFQNTYLNVFSAAMNNATAARNTTAAKPFPVMPSNATWSYTLVNVSANATATVNSILGRRSLLQSVSATVTAPTGTVWNVTFNFVYNNVENTYALTYTASSNSIINGTVTAVAITFSYPDLSVTQVVNVLSALGVPIIPPIGGYGGVIAVGGIIGRRLIERRSAKATASALPSVAADAEPSDVAYGTDKALYEIFAVPTDYYVAGAFCAARGARLASYSSEGSQIFVDILCDGAAGMQCWVEGNAAGSCSAVSSSAVHQMGCAKQMPFVCVKDKGYSAKAVAAVSAVSVSEMAKAKPSDVAYDTHRTSYEIFTTPVDYFTAGSICMARGAELANYSSESAQVFVDVLCEAATGQVCWVEGASAGACSSVHASALRQSACAKRHPFVCAKAPRSKAL